MGIGKIFTSTGVDAITGVGNVLDKLFTSKDEKLTHQEVRMRIAQQPDLVQAEVNKIQAQHKSIWVSGARPAVIWVCALSLLYNYVLRDIMGWFFVNFVSNVELPPELNMETLNTVLFGVLGLGAYRTIEKLGNKTR